MGALTSESQIGAFYHSMKPCVRQADSSDESGFRSRCARKLRSVQHRIFKLFTEMIDAMRGVDVIIRLVGTQIPMRTLDPATEE